MKDYKFRKGEKVCTLKEQSKVIYSIVNFEYWESEYVRLKFLNSQHFRYSKIEDLIPLTLDSLLEGNFILEIEDSNLDEFTKMGEERLNIICTPSCFCKSTNYIHVDSLSQLISEDFLLVENLPKPIVPFQIFKDNVEFLEESKAKEQAYVDLVESQLESNKARFAKGSTITYEELKEIGFKTGDIVYTLDSDNKGVEEWIVLNNIAYNRRTNFACSNKFLLGCSNILYVHPIEFINAEQVPITIDTNIITTIKY